MPEISKCPSCEKSLLESLDYLAMMLFSTSLAVKVKKKRMKSVKKMMMSQATWRTNTMLLIFNMKSIPSTSTSVRRWTKCSQRFGVAGGMMFRCIDVQITIRLPYGMNCIHLKLLVRYPRCRSAIVLFSRSAAHYPATTSCSGGRGRPGRGSKLVEIFQKGENNLLCTINNTSVYRNAISKEYFSVFVSLVEKFSNGLGISVPS